jgi:hypothetical protein
MRALRSAGGLTLDSYGAAFVRVNPASCRGIFVTFTSGVSHCASVFESDSDMGPKYRSLRVGEWSQDGEAHSQITPGPGSREAYEEDRKSRLHRNRLVGFSLCFALWVLSVVVLGVESLHGREGAGAVAVYLAVGAITLGVAAVIRGIYVVLTKRNLWWSPWVFVLAAVVVISIYLV